MVPTGIIQISENYVLLFFSIRICHGIYFWHCYCAKVKSQAGYEEHKKHLLPWSPSLDALFNYGVKQNVLPALQELIETKETSREEAL